MSLHVCTNMHIHIKHTCMHNVAAMPPIHMYACVCACLRMKIYMHMAVHTLVRGRYTADFILHEPDTQKEESLPCDTLLQVLSFFRSCPLPPP